MDSTGHPMLGCWLEDPMVDAFHRRGFAMTLPHGSTLAEVDRILAAHSLSPGKCNAQLTQPSPAHPYRLGMRYFWSRAE